jgi:hypothetical protein
LNLQAYVDNQPTGGVDPFGLQWRPLDGRGMKNHTKITRRQLEKMMKPNGRLPKKVRDMLDKGCIGLCMSYLAMGWVNPEDAPGTVCFPKRDAAVAKARECPSCCENFVFAKQGKWDKEKGKPKPDSEGHVPGDSISFENGQFNYVTYFPSTHTYAFISNNTIGGRQIVYLWHDPPVLDGYPKEIWCSVCRPKGKYTYKNF